MIVDVIDTHSALPRHCCGYDHPPPCHDWLVTLNDSPRRSYSEDDQIKDDRITSIAQYPPTVSPSVLICGPEQASLYPAEI